MRILKGLAVFFLLLSGGLIGAPEGKIEDMTTRIEFPDNVVFESSQGKVDLKATGVATRSKFFVRVYSVAHYMENPVVSNATGVLEEVFNPKKVKQLTLIWVRNVDAKRIQEGFQESFERTVSRENYEELRPEIEKFISMFDSDAKQGDRYVLRWVSGGNIEVEVNGAKRGEIKGEDFAAATWGIWLGPKSIVNRNKLISIFTK